MEVYLAGTNRSVDTGDTYFKEISNSTASGAVIGKKKINERSLISKKPIYQGEPLKARIEYSRYLVDCPNCNSAEFAFEDKLFFCSQCLNSDIQGKIRKVKMPKDRKEIEVILGKRAIKNRHWFPNETVEDLDKENLKMEVI